MIQNKGIFKKIYLEVKKIPEGRVTTYGQIARTVGTNPRTVGWALHANRETTVPCHRVVNKDGRLAPGYAFGGEGEQKKRLEKEGVEFNPSGQVIRLGPSAG